MTYKRTKQSLLAATAGVLPLTVGLLLAAPAAAQVVDPDCTGSNPGVVTCRGPSDTPPGPATYANGITHTATAGDITVNVGGGVTSFGTGGFNTTATGAHSITMTRAASTLGSSNMSTAAATGTRSSVIIGATTAGGDISISNAAGTIQGVAAFVQYGIRAESTGAGNIDIDMGASTISLSGTATNPGVAALYAESNGGDIEITSGSMSGRQYGIQAITTGAGDIAITTTGQVRGSTTAGVAIAAIQAIAETGNITLDLGDGIGDANAGGLAFLESDGLISVTVRSLFGVSGTSTTLNFNQTGLTPLTVAGGGPAVVNIAGDDLAFGTWFGGIDASANTGGVTVNLLAGKSSWSFRDDAVQFGTGGDTINNAGLIVAASGGAEGGILGRVLVEATIPFGDGEDVFNNSGTLVVGDSKLGFNPGSTTGLRDDFFGPENAPSVSAVMAADAVFEDLEAFNNSGRIVLGGRVSEGEANNRHRFYTSDPVGEAACRAELRGEGLPFPPPDGFLCTDSPVIGDTDELTATVLSMPGAVFTGSGASTILLDASFGHGAPQYNCQDRTGGEEVFFRLPGADCIDLRGGATAGSTQIIVRDTIRPDQGAANPEGIVIIDVAGGVSAAEHFTLSPLSDHYATADGRGVINQGLLVFPLVYDAATQQHKLVGVLGAAGLQQPLLTHAAQALSRQATAAGLDERVQAVRDGSAAGGGFWGEVSFTAAERELLQTVTAIDDTIGFRNDHEQDTFTLTLGGDVILGDWLVGGSIGYAHSELDFANSGDAANLEGVSFGLHGGYQTGAWFVNAAFNQAVLQIDHVVPTFDLGSDTDIDTEGTTQGLRVDGGLRLPLAGALYVEPLATVSWVRAAFDDLVVVSPDNVTAATNTAVFDDATSLRAALGARLGLGQDLGPLRVSYALTGRFWNEFDGESAVLIQSDGPDASVTNAFDGSFSEIGARISVSDGDGRVAGHLDARGGFGDGYSSVGLSAGFRYQW